MDGGLILLLLLLQLPAQILLCLLDTSDCEVTLLCLQGTRTGDTGVESLPCTKRRAPSTMWGRRQRQGCGVALVRPLGMMWQALSHRSPGVTANGLTRALCSRTMACFFSSSSSFSRIMDALPSDPSSRDLGPASSTRL